MSTFNGAQHLQAQLASFLDQDHTEWDLWVSDDGSEDATCAIVEDFRQRHADRHDIRLLQGPGQGSAANFLSLLCHPDLPPGPVALSDQDDIWLPQKLSRAARLLHDAGPVALYGGQSLHVDDDLRQIGRSRLGHARPSFTNALTQNVISGHSTVLSAGALEIVRQAGPKAVPHHDWWLYQLISAAGGDVFVDDMPVLLYRQHAGNVMGAHQGMRAWWARIEQVFGGTYGDWLDCNIAALNEVAALFTVENRAILKSLAQAPRPRRATRGWRAASAYRAAVMARCRVTRQSLHQTVLLYVAVLLGRV